MSTAVLDIAPSARLNKILEATTNVLSGIQILESSCFGPAHLIEAAAVDLSVAMDTLANLGPAAGHPRLTELEEMCDDDTGRQVCAQIRLNAMRIAAESSGLSLELRRLLADTRDAIAIASGSTGMYDAYGRTTSGQLRRTRGTM
ncbi:MAG: hypothetical protein JWN39_4106 [Ilumatobacteraceae bacterium]|nr:hypothetical protein [Ilumatobacteraceae bacterium]